MKYETTESRNDSGGLVITFTFQNGKAVVLTAGDFSSGAAMLEAAKKDALG